MKQANIDVSKLKSKVSDLPEIVPLVEGATLYRASNKIDIFKLAEQIRSIPDDYLYAFLGFVYGHGMMAIRNFTIGGFLLNMTAKKMQKKYAGEKYTAWMMTLKTLTHTSFEDVQRVEKGKMLMPKTKEAHKALKNKSLDLMFELRNGIIKHMTHGKDREEKSSVGGLSQREINAINNASFLLLNKKVTHEKLRNLSLGYALNHTA